jgi:hypothetical protein
MRISKDNKKRWANFRLDAFFMRFGKFAFRQGRFSRRRQKIYKKIKNFFRGCFVK